MNTPVKSNFARIRLYFAYQVGTGILRSVNCIRAKIHAIAQAIAEATKPEILQLH